MAKKKSSKEYAEFKLKGETFDYTGRVYPAKGEGNPFVYLTLNDVFTIQCHLIEGKKSSFIGWPSYKSGKEYKSLVYVDKDLNEEIDLLITQIEAALESLDE